MYIEMGGDFWLDEMPDHRTDQMIPAEFRLGSDFRLLFSGRTAIDLVIRDISANRKIANVYMPSYCCYSMVQPFHANGIAVKFYDVSFYDSITYAFDHDFYSDIFFSMSYFGYEDASNQKLAQFFKQKGSIVVEDITHNLLLNNKYCSCSDYLVASPRKWFNVLSAGLACKMQGKFIDIEMQIPPASLIEAKLNAMTKKSKYLKNPDKKLKESFLSDFSYFNINLRKNYVKYEMDPYSRYLINKADIDLIRSKRRKNSKIVHEALKNTSQLNFLHGLSQNDCPLFIPVLMETGVRDSLVRYLIHNNIYCPNHWPPVNDVEVPYGKSNIYSRELSLLCDDRYSEDDIEFYTCLINDFFKMQPG